MIATGFTDITPGHIFYGLRYDVVTRNPILDIIQGEPIALPVDPNNLQPGDYVQWMFSKEVCDAYIDSNGHLIVRTL